MRMYPVWSGRDTFNTPDNNQDPLNIIGRHVPPSLIQHTKYSNNNNNNNCKNIHLLLNA